MATWLLPALSVIAMVEDWTASLKVAETAVPTGMSVAPGTGCRSVTVGLVVSVPLVLKTRSTQ